MTSHLPVVGPVEVGPIAHGGHCVARHEGRVIFVRHSLPGERVLVQLTDTSQDRFWRGDAVEVLTASDDRVPVRCPIAGPGLCGGCDFQHVDLAGQRRLKAAVVSEQLRRLAKLEWHGEVEEVVGAATAEGLGWRTRMRYHADASGHAALRVHRSNQLVALPPQGCPISDPQTPRVTGQNWPSGAEVLVASAPSGTALLVDGQLRAGTADLVERAAGRDWVVSADGFWQVHPQAAETLVGAVLSGIEPRPGETAFDLYSGVGLFTGALADAGCEVWSVESNRAAVSCAGRNLADVADRVHLSAARVEGRLAALPKRIDLVVLDPPRAGAGRVVISAMLRRHPRALAYVACDPAALARDLATADGLGYHLTSLRAFDLFPMTHHIECVAILQP
ncbi:MAG TPA: TRAM domain-containing protein [Propionibacteriaceae bacterium]|nr:TRAM domain-containing protein [Propionibacteriaceae bacterium]